MTNILQMIIHFFKRLFGSRQSTVSNEELPEINLAFADLANMLTHEKNNPVPNLEFFHSLNMDYSIESIQHIDEYLLSIREDDLETESKIIPIVLRTAAYVGESIRKNDQSKKWYWIDFETAKQQKPDFLNGIDHSLEYAAILTDGNMMSFRLNKVLKFLKNGEEDSLYSFAYFILNYDESKVENQV